MGRLIATPSPALLMQSRHLIDAPLGPCPPAGARSVPSPPHPPLRRSVATSISRSPLPFAWTSSRGHDADVGIPFRPTTLSTLHLLRRHAPLVTVASPIKSCEGLFDRSASPSRILRAPPGRPRRPRKATTAAVRSTAHRHPPPNLRARRRTIPGMYGEGGLISSAFRVGKPLRAQDIPCAVAGAGAPTPTRQALRSTTQGAPGSTPSGNPHYNTKMNSKRR